MKLRNKKTGKIIEYSIELNEWSEDDQEWYSFGNYDSIAELNEEWEDYDPVEPLIKDEKIRKVVRDWAEANGIKEIIIFDQSNNAPYTPVGAVDFAENGSHLEIRFRTEERFDTDRIYTIGELCGEEGE